MCKLAPGALAPLFVSPRSIRAQDPRLFPKSDRILFQHDFIKDDNRGRSEDPNHILATATHF
jgi:hypothetical protein